MASNKKNNQENMDNACVVCFRSVKIYSFGACDHPVCFECSTRMRVLCKQNECPICRQDLPKVVYTSSIRPYSSIATSSLLFDTHFGIYFDCSDAKAAFKRLLVHPCGVCPDNPPFPNFAQLKDHMRKEHELFFCELCTDNLKVFDSERRYYTRAQLALHRRKGDPDNTSYRGHPLCQFCDQRYLDNDELFRHLRKEHFFCHFCDADGLHQFYANYNELREHFRASHYLCEEGNCREEKFTSVFRTDIDYKAHRVQNHSHHMGKAAAKQARTLELEFTLASRPKEDSRRGGARPRGGGRRAAHSTESRSLDEPSTSRPSDSITFSNGSQRPNDATLNDPQAFPSLGRNDPAQLPPPGERDRPNDSLAQRVGKRSNLTVRSSYVQGFGGEAAADEEFPSLVPGNPPKQRTNEPKKSNGHAFVVRVNGQSKHSSADNTGAGGSNVSVGVQLNQGNAPRPASNAVGAQVTRMASSQNIRMQPTSRLRDSEDFPSLSSTNGKDGRSHVLWGPPPAKSKAPEPKKEPKPPSRVDDFPALAVGERPATPSGTWITKKGKGVASIEIPVGEGGKIQADSSKKGKGGKKKSKTAAGGATAIVKPSSESATPPQVPEPVLERSPSVSEVIPKPEPVKNEVKRRSVVCNMSSDFPPLDPASVTESPLFEGKLAPPPPGFGAKPAAAPPKLVIPERPALDTGLISPTQLTFTSSNGQSYPVLPGFQYLQPPDFAHRNKNLISTLGDLFGAKQDAYQDFRQVSAQYRGGTIGPGEYYDQCAKLLGATCFEAVFPELMVLLPDIEKQQGLLGIYRRKQGGNAPTGEPFIVCATCNQVLAPGDLRHHLASHTLEKNFPSLSLASGTTSWGKKK